MKPLKISKTVRGSVESYSLRFNVTGWAEIVLDDRGLFYCQSDWGNFCHWWDAYPGRNDMPNMQLFKELLAGINWKYFIEKSYQGEKKFRAEETKKSIKKEILRGRRSKELDDEEARDYWDWVTDEDFCDATQTIHMCREKEGFLEQVFCGDTYGLTSSFVYDWSECAKHFAKYVFPLFQEELKKEFLIKNTGEGALT